MEKPCTDRSVYCPVAKSAISDIDCFDAALVYEEMSPLSEFPLGFVFTKDNKSICLKCPYHPK